jgi:hypothetical protein
MVLTAELVRVWKTGALPRNAMDVERLSQPETCLKSFTYAFNLIDAFPLQCHWTRALLCVAFRNCIRSVKVIQPTVTSTCFLTRCDAPRKVAACSQHQQYFGVLSFKAAFDTSVTNSFTFTQFADE